VSNAGKNLEGQVVDGKFPLLRCLGESGHSAVFLTEQKVEPRRAAIKLMPATASNAEIQISGWEAAAKLSHPHLVRLFETGRCQIGNEAYCYVVMEYAEENLYQILPDRPLSAEEAREMLPSVLDALRYLHRQGFVHGHIKPANIMASGDQVKLSGDGVLRMGQPGGVPREASLYDPPEAASTGIHPTRDIWSLGVTLVEALTQHPPARTGGAGDEDLLAQSLAMPFSDIVRNCLRPRPEQRWTLDQIAASLVAAAGPKPAPAATPERSMPRLAEPAKQPTFAKPGLLVGASLLALTLLVLFFVKLLHHAPVEEFPAGSSSATAPQPPSAKPQTPVVAESAPPSNPAPATIPAPEPAKSDTPGAVVEKVLPEIPRSASETIQGTIRVKVRVKVDVSGNVSSATLVSSGSSAYFARLALQSAQRWRFAPAKRNGQGVPSAWILKFEFRQSGARAGATLE
jgi:eukaryotic-like serine/threonine-protein kinase